MRKSIRVLLMIWLIMMILSSCSKQMSYDAYEELIINLESMGYTVEVEDVEESIFKGERKWLTVDDIDNISVYLYESNEKMEKDASYISADGFTYDNRKQTTAIDWVSYPHFYKSQNMIILYVGDNSRIINTLEELVGPQFAGEIYHSPSDLPNFPVPLGVNPNLSDEQIKGVLEYWKYSDEWALTMPTNKWDSGVWNIGIGPSHEFGLGIPYKFIDRDIVQAEDLAALTFAAVEYWYYDGLSVVVLTGFRGDTPNEQGFGVIQYISTIQPDIKTSRGITIGDSIVKLKEAYPEVKELEGYWTENNPDHRIANHDNCYIYAPEGTNRSMMFLTKEDKIVQIDIGDGLDGQYCYPASPGFHSK